MDRQADRQTDRQTDRERERQADRQTDRQREREADRQTEDRHYDTLLNTHAKQLRNTNPRCACILDPKIISRALSIKETY